MRFIIIAFQCAILALVFAWFGLIATLVYWGIQALIKYVGG